MAEIPTLQHPLHLPADAQRGIGAAVRHALTFASSMTDILIQEGRVMRAKSARGTLALHQLFAAIPPFIVTRDHIVHYLAQTLAAEDEPAGSPARACRPTRQLPPTARQVWDTRIQPLLARQSAFNVRLDGGNGHSLRHSLYLQDGGQLALTLRIVPSTIAPLASLSLPGHLLATLAESNSGLVLITGPSGSGKSETAMSLLDWHNAQHAGHILTVEDPVEKKLVARKAIVTQREVGLDVPSLADGLRDALRTSPDLLLVSAIPDAEVAAQTIHAGESGALMIATTHARSAAGALRKILGHTGHAAPALRSVLAGNLVAVVRQALVPACDGGRYLMAADVLFNTRKVTRAIEQGDWLALETSIHAEQLDSDEWVPMNDRLVDLVRRGEIDATEAMRHTSHIPSLKKRLGAIVPASCRR